MGTSLHVEGQPWGVLTLDALEVGTFGAEAQSELRELIMLVEAALRTTRLEAETRAAPDAGQSRADGTPADNHEILGQSESIARLLHEIDVVADSELPILLLGETGVGKELFAHRVPAVATPRQAAGARELRRPARVAGRERAVRPRQGRVLRRGGRPARPLCRQRRHLFLDEVGELPLLVQAKLLRALQNGEIQRLGDDRPRRVDVRIVAATNRSLKDAVRDGDFAPTCTTGCRSIPSPSRRCARGNDVLLLAGRYLEQNRARLGLHSLRLALDAERRCAATAGRAMCASWSMSSAAPPSRR